MRSYDPWHPAMVELRGRYLSRGVPIPPEALFAAALAAGFSERELRRRFEARGRWIASPDPPAMQARWQAKPVPRSKRSRR